MPMRDSLDPDCEDLFGVEASCWACGQLVRLPSDLFVTGVTVDDIHFKCASCEAVTQPKRRSKTNRRGLIGHASIRLLGRVCTVGVPAIVLYIGYASLLLLLPNLCDDFPLNMPLPALAQFAMAIFFEFQILWNYFATVFTPPGSPATDVEYGSISAGKFGRLAGFSLCHRCQAPRPPRAHHCSVCQVCVMDMDHHCPYVNNCIGYANRRSFILFLIYATAGSVQALVAFVWMVVRCSSGHSCVGFPPACLGSKLCNQVFHSSSRLPKILWADWSQHQISTYSTNPFTWNSWIVLAVMISLFVLSFIVSVLVGFLLICQVRTLAYDSTQLELLTLESPSFTFGEKVSHILGTIGAPVTWLWPQIGPLPVSFGGRQPPPQVEPAKLETEHGEERFLLV